jgi:hypothetical protein
MKTEDVMRITLGFLGGDLGAYAEDVPGSCERYAARLRDALHAAYPDAEIDVRYDETASGATPQTYRPAVYGAEDLDEATIQAEVEAIAQEQFEIAYETGEIR